MLGKRPPLTDLDILQSHHKSNILLFYRTFQFLRFLRDEDKDKQIDTKRLSNDDYGQILAKKYYDKLYKEFAIIDLLKYKTGK